MRRLVSDLDQKTPIADGWQVDGIDPCWHRSGFCLVVSKTGGHSQQPVPKPLRRFLASLQGTVGPSHALRTLTTLVPSVRAISRSEYPSARSHGTWSRRKTALGCPTGLPDRVPR